MGVNIFRSEDTRMNILHRIFYNKTSWVFSISNISSRMKCKIKMQKEKITKNIYRYIYIYSARTEEQFKNKSLYSGISQLSLSKKKKNACHISAEDALFLSVIINMLARFQVGLTLHWIAAWTYIIRNMDFGGKTELENVKDLLKTPKVYWRTWSYSSLIDSVS